jgi:hypothetical protein
MFLRTQFLLVETSPALNDARGQDGIGRPATGCTPYSSDGGRFVSMM